MPTIARGGSGTPTGADNAVANWLANGMLLAWHRVPRTAPKAAQDPDEAMTG